jgi:hypothetical protein
MLLLYARTGLVLDPVICASHHSKDDRHAIQCPATGWTFCTCWPRTAIPVSSTQCSPCTPCPLHGLGPALVGIRHRAGLFYQETNFMCRLGTSIKIGAAERTLS